MAKHDDRDEVLKAVWPTAHVNTFPDSSFAYVTPGKDGEGKTPRENRHLPYKDENGKVDPAHVQNALARLNQTNISATAKQSARQKLVSAAKGAGVQVEEKSSEQELLDIDTVELSLTRTPAVQEEFVVTKTAVKKKDEAAQRVEFEKLDDEALFALYQKAQKPLDEEEEEEEEEDDDDKGKKKKGKVPPQFNFDKADDATKTALRAVGEALVGITDLPAPVAEFAKSIKEKLPQNGQKSTDELIEFAKSRMPGLVEAIQQPIQKQLDETTKSVEELQGERDLAAMRDVAAELPGDVEVVAKRLLVFKKSMTSEEFEAYIEEQKGLKAQVAKSEVFQRQSSTHPAAASVEARINQKATELIAKSAENGVKDLEAAYGAIAKTDPALWREYQDEVRNRPKQA